MPTTLSLESAIALHLPLSVTLSKGHNLTCVWITIAPSRGLGCLELNNIGTVFSRHLMVIGPCYLHMCVKSIPSQSLSKRCLHPLSIISTRVPTSLVLVMSLGFSIITPTSETCLQSLGLGYSPFTNVPPCADLAGLFHCGLPTLLRGDPPQRVLLSTLPSPVVRAATVHQSHS